ncbi:MAG TPA: SRPBCC domain-containing protein [Candidatus Acidoferrales bacterium]
MIYKIVGGIVLALVVLVLVALEVRTTGTYERTFNASNDQVWRMWNDTDSIKQWWGPTGYSAPFIRNDLRVGGTYLWGMKSPKGEMSWNTGVYREVVPNRRIVSTLSFADESGKALPGSKAPVPGRWPDAVTVITEFSESSGKTKVTVTEVGIPLLIKILSRIAWDQQFDKIQGLLGGTAGSLQPATNTFREVAGDNSRRHSPEPNSQVPINSPVRSIRLASHRTSLALI